MQAFTRDNVRERPHVLASNPEQLTSIGIAIRRSLQGAIVRLQQQAAALRAASNRAQTVEDLERVRRQVVDFRKRYLRTETTLDFYADSINTRTNPEVSALEPVPRTR